MAGGGAGVETTSRTENESEKGIVTLLRWSLEVEELQRGQKGEERVRSKGLQEDSQVTVG